MLQHSFTMRCCSSSMRPMSAPSSSSAVPSLHGHTARQPCTAVGSQRSPSMQPLPGRRRVVLASATPEEREAQRAEQDRLLKQRGDDQIIIYGSALAMTALASLAYFLWRDDITDFFLDSALAGGDFGIGDLAGGSMWGLSLWFTSPLQLLLLFFGDYDTVRPSDRIMRTIGAATGGKVDDLDYQHPAWIRATASAVCLGVGFSIAFLLNQSLGDATWSVSTGLGACMGSAMYEASRPKRLNVEEAQLLEEQWKDFARFADARLSRTGRCHESEVFTAFRKANAKYRREEVISDMVLRDMVRNWHPDSDRTPRGFYKNLSLEVRLDPFTLESSGTAAPVKLQQMQQQQQQQPAQVGTATEGASQQ